MICVSQCDLLTIILSHFVKQDKALIMDVLGVIRICRDPDRLCTTWTVSPIDGTGYTLMAYLPRAQQQHVEVTHDDINMIECVNPMRIRVGVVQFPQGTWALKVRITSHTAPVSFTTYDAVRVNVRRSLLGGGGSRSIGGWVKSLVGGGGGRVAKRQRTASGSSI